MVCRTRPAISKRSTAAVAAALFGRRRGAGEHFGSELEAKLPVLNPATLGSKPFAGADGRQGPDHSHQVTMPLRLDLEDAEPRILI